MKIVVFGAERRVGALVGEMIIDLNRGSARLLREQGNSDAEAQAATRLSARLLTFIEQGATSLSEAQRVIDSFAKLSPSEERETPKMVFNAGDVKIHAPWPERRIACVGGNYAAHLGRNVGEPAWQDRRFHRSDHRGSQERPANGDSGKCPPRWPARRHRFLFPSALPILTTKAKSPSSSASAAKIFRR